MYIILYETTFKASHGLAYQNGQKEPAHEHHWRVCAAISAERLNKDDLVMDFNDLKSLLNSILRDFQGHPLETLACFKERNASAECVAQILYEQLAPRLPTNVRLEYMEVMEAEGCRARYSVQA